MFKVIIKKQGQETNGATFETKAEADAWVIEGKQKEWWGKQQRWENEKDLSDEQKALALDSAIMQNPYPTGDEPKEFMTYLMPADFSVEIKDIGAEVLEEKMLQESIEAFSLSNHIKAKIRVMNIKKLKAGTWTPAKWNQFKNDTNIAAANKALDQASLNDFKASIELVSSDFYSADEKAEIAAMVDKHNAKWGF